MLLSFFRFFWLTGVTPVTPDICTAQNSGRFELYAYARCLSRSTYISQLFLEPEWAIDSEAMRARGIIVLVKSSVVKKN